MSSSLSILYFERLAPFRMVLQRQMETDSCLASTSQATALTLCNSASHSSRLACFLNQRLQTSRQYTTQVLYSSPPASLAQCRTLFVMTLLCALVILSSSSSHGMTSSTRCFRRSATLVTSLAGTAEGIISFRVVGNTIHPGLAAR